MVLDLRLTMNRISGDAGGTLAELSVGNATTGGAVDQTARRAVWSCEERVRATAERSEA